MKKLGLIPLLTIFLIGFIIADTSIQCGGRGGSNCYNQPSECACNPGYACEYHEENMNGGTSMWGECVYTGLTGCVSGQERDCQGTRTYGQECINGEWGPCVLRQQCENGGFYVNCNEANGFVLYGGICVHTRISGNIQGSGLPGFYSYADCQSASKSSQTPSTRITGGVTQTIKDNPNNNFLIISLCVTAILIILVICLTTIIIKRKNK